MFEDMGPASVSAQSNGGSHIDRYLGGNIRLARERRGTSPQDLGHAVGASPSSIVAYEAGAERIRPRMLYEIAVTLDVTLASLFGLAKG